MQLPPCGKPHASCLAALVFLKPFSTLTFQRRLFNPQYRPIPTFISMGVCLLTRPVEMKIAFRTEAAVVWNWPTILTTCWVWVCDWKYLLLNLQLTNEIYGVFELENSLRNRFWEAAVANGWEHEVVTSWPSRRYQIDMVYCRKSFFSFLLLLVCVFVCLQSPRRKSGQVRKHNMTDGKHWAHAYARRYIFRAPKLSG